MRSGVRVPYAAPNTSYIMKKDFESMIGQQVHKLRSGKPFKSGNKVNTVKGIINHPQLNIPAFTFFEDDSYVECRKCEIVVD